MYERTPGGKLAKELGHLFANWSLGQLGFYPSQTGGRGPSFLMIAFQGGVSQVLEKDIPER